jgi:azurin
LRSSHQIIRLSVTPGQMKYDQPEITAKAGKPIALVFNNPDVLQHNVVISKPGSMEKIGAAANAMMTQADGFAKAFKPDLPEVLGGTPLVNPGETVLLKLDPLTPGDYPVLCTFPGHWLLMRCTLKVVP